MLFQRQFPLFTRFGPQNSSNRAQITPLIKLRNLTMKIKACSFFTIIKCKQKTVLFTVLTARLTVQKWACGESDAFFSFIPSTLFFFSPQLVKLCSGMIEAGKAYVSANKLFVNGIRDLSQQCKKDEMISVRFWWGKHGLCFSLLLWF